MTTTCARRKRPSPPRDATSQTVPRPTAAHAATHPQIVVRATLHLHTRDCVGMAPVTGSVIEIADPVRVFTAGHTRTPTPRGARLRGSPPWRRGHWSDRGSFGGQFGEGYPRVRTRERWENQHSPHPSVVVCRVNCPADLTGAAASIARGSWPRRVCPVCPDRGRIQGTTRSLEPAPLPAREPGAGICAAFSSGATLFFTMLIALCRRALPARCAQGVPRSAELPALLCGAHVPSASTARSSAGPQPMRVAAASASPGRAKT